jgi:hypothetical protein
MALPSSGTLSMSQIKTELGSSNNSLRALSAQVGFSTPDAISEFYGYGAVYTIGQAALGGIIAYINGGGSSGTSGLVATVNDISTGAPWGCPGDGLLGNPSWTGQENTDSIVAGCSTPGIAARLCADLVQGGYSDWYLPSISELTHLYNNRYTIGGFVTDLKLSFYWSSSPTGNYDDAWAIQFSSGNTSGWGRSAGYYVRAVRYF